MADDSMFGENCFWRETQRPARLLIFDARLIIFIFIFIFYVRIWTLALLLTMSGLFWFLESKGLSMPNAIRRARFLIVGPIRRAKPYRSRRFAVDYEFEAPLYIKKFAAMKTMPQPAGRTTAKKKGALSWIGI